MKVPMYDLAAQYYTIREEMDAAIARVLTSGTLILGPELEAFEREFSRLMGRGGGVGVGSGSDALFVALRALDVGPGDEVIAPPNSCVSVVEAIVRTGAYARLVDIDEERLTLDPGLIEGAISPRTRAIVAIHAHGTPAEIEPIQALAERRCIPLVEDCAQATGALYHGRRVGIFGTLGCFSLNPSKVFGGLGDGGIIVSDDVDLLHRARLVRNHGRERYDGLSQIMGSNTRLDELSAAVLRAKLQHLDQWNEARRERARRYVGLLSDLPLQLPPWPVRCEPAFNQFVVRLRERDRVLRTLHEHGVAARVHYRDLAHLSPAFRHLGYRPGDLPVSERCAQLVLSLPIYPELEESAQTYVADILRTAMSA